MKVEEARHKEECSEEIKHVCEQHITVPAPAPGPYPPPPPIFSPGPPLARTRRGAGAAAEGEPGGGGRHALLEALLRLEAEQRGRSPHPVRAREAGQGTLGGVLVAGRGVTHHTRPHLLASGFGQLTASAQRDAASADFDQLTSLEHTDAASAGPGQPPPGSPGPVSVDPGLLSLDPGPVSLEARVKAAMIQILGGSRAAVLEQQQTPAPGPAPQPDQQTGVVFEETPAPPVPALAAVPPPPPRPPPPVPRVTITELPSEPGCRSFSTTTCVQVPIGEPPSPVPPELLHPRSAFSCPQDRAVRQVPRRARRGLLLRPQDGG